MLDSDDSTRVVTISDVEDQTTELTQIQLMYDDTYVTVSRPEDLPLYIGRDHETCHIAVSEDVVSRQHCKIDASQGRLTIKDQSTNGTFLKLGQYEEITLRKGQVYPLNGRGMIKLGKPFSMDDVAIIYFKCR